MRIFDLHCDTISAVSGNGGALRVNDLHFDLERARRAGVRGQVFALFSRSREPETAWAEIRRQLECFYRQLEQNRERMYLLQSGGDWREEGESIAAVLHLEGADCILEDLERLDHLYDRGLRSLGLTWNHDNIFAAGVGGEGRERGLTPLGRELVRRLAGMALALDLSHLAEAAFFEVLALYPRPLMVSHSNIQALCPHRRNLSDQQLDALRENGGIIGLNQVKYFIDGARPSADRLVDHMVYAAERIGVEHLALGSDFDGAQEVALGGVEEYPRLLALMMRRGFTERETAMIAGGNARRLLAQALEQEVKQVVI